jgi:hypothetical protein
MSDQINTETNRRPVSEYQQRKNLLNGIISGEISLVDAMNRIQLKETKPTRPYCKVTSGGALALYGISKQPLVMYADQWNKLLRVAKSNYLENYIKYNESRLKFKTRKPYYNNNKQDSDDTIIGIDDADQL